MHNNCLMGLKVWWSWGSGFFFSKSKQVGGFFKFDTKLQVLKRFLLFLSKKTTIFFDYWPMIKHIKLADYYNLYFFYRLQYLEWHLFIFTRELLIKSACNAINKKQYHTISPSTPLLTRPTAAKFQQYSHTRLKYHPPTHPQIFKYFPPLVLSQF